MPTYKLIASNTLSSPTTSVTFSSIPATYTDLIVKLSARCTSTANNYPNFVHVRINGDTTANYSYIEMLGQDATIYSGKNSSATIFDGGFTINSDTNTSNTFSNAEFYFPNYTSSTTRQISNYGVAENNTNLYATIGAATAYYRGTSPITSITFTLTAGAGNYMTGSFFSLYGIKNS